jgi:hypothetical protein
MSSPSLVSTASEKWDERVGDNLEADSNVDHPLDKLGRRMKTPMESFIYSENIKNFEKRLEAPTDDTQRKILLTLLAEEEAKGEQLVAEPTWYVRAQSTKCLQIATVKLSAN